MKVGPAAEQESVCGCSAGRTARSYYPALRGPGKQQDKAQENKCPQNEHYSTVDISITYRIHGPGYKTNDYKEEES
jgi:hypothetical protein